MENKNWIKRYIVDVMPCITVLLYVLAIGYELSYFSVFGIDILSYFSLTETLINIAEPLLFFTLFFFFSVVTINYYILAVPVILKPFSLLKKFVNYVTNKVLPSKPIPILLKITILVLINLFCYIILAPLFYIWFFLLNLIVMQEFLLIILSETKNKNRRILLLLIITILYFIFSYMIWYYLLLNTNCNGMEIAFLGLVSPMLIFLIYLFARMLIIDKNTLLDYIKTFSSRERAFVLFAYYLFSIVVFYQSGFEYGEEIKKNDKTVFSIQMSDGSVFDDRQYGYISKVGNNIFLYKKKTDENYIINTGDIKYMNIKIDDLRTPMSYKIFCNVKKWMTESI